MGIMEAIDARHSVDGTMDEILKDADVLHHTKFYFL